MVPEPTGNLGILKNMFVRTRIGSNGGRTTCTACSNKHVLARMWPSFLSEPVPESLKSPFLGMQIRVIFPENSGATFWSKLRTKCLHHSYFSTSLRRAGNSASRTAHFISNPLRLGEIHQKRFPSSSCRQFRKLHFSGLELSSSRFGMAR